MENLKMQAREVVQELIEKAHLKAGSFIVIGCSTSEILGETIGHASSYETAEEIYLEIAKVLKEQGISLAAQCCEHLNRALIVEEKVALQKGYEIVNVIPQPKAGGSFATAAYKNMEKPVAVEHIKADAGMDIGSTLIGMHLKEVAVPLRLVHHTIGKANLTFARVRPKFVGGVRAVYDEALL